ncbi:G-protein coupled receptor 35-like [Protobothrops mucrosquamatus]|uniref:G-protein coupled receptor 35-like n=1 Tax=Protobothrops mucrosquamatus TaxID=103944 RepID=UPI000775FBD7|nr:G-protein coupled receptor 35-like [Protobothrops mucrosquamatus]
MNFSNHTSEKNILLAQAIIYVPVFFIGVILNVFALRIFCCKLIKWTETRVYMTNLAITDCLFLFTLPFKIVFNILYICAIPIYMNKLCMVLEISYFINRYMSIFLITIIALDRYIAIRYPLQAKNIRSPLKSALVCGLFWIIIISIVFVSTYLDKKKSKAICFQTNYRIPSVPSFAAVIWGFLIPLIILSFCSVQIIKKLTRKKKIHLHEKKLIQKAINIILANLTTFIICFLPLHVAYFIIYIDSINASDAKQNLSLKVVIILANTNCCLDAFCYYFVSQEFQEASLVLKTQNQAPENQDTKII